jgi:hypothetical protein
MNVKCNKTWCRLFVPPGLAEVYVLFVPPGLAEVYVLFVPPGLALILILIK